MKALKVDHIGIAVKNLDETLKFYSDVLGLELGGTEVVEEQKVKVAFLPVGDTEVELLESTSEERLKREFYDHQPVRILQQSIEHQLLEGSLSPFSGALKLLEAFFGEKRSD